MKIKAFDYCSRQDFEIPDDLDFDYISVKVITGDEVISFYKTDEPNPPKLVWYHDTSDDRRIDYFDAENKKYRKLRYIIYRWVHSPSLKKYKHMKRR